MEKRAKWNSCRLAPHGDSGRVRWCVGQERTWASKLRILAFVPLVLLLFIAVAILLTHFLREKGLEQNYQSSGWPEVRQTHQEEDEVIDTEDRHIFKFARTSYIPKINYNLIKRDIHPRKIRETQFSDEESSSDTPRQNIMYKLENPWTPPKESEFPTFQQRIAKTEYDEIESIDFSEPEDDRENHHNFWKDHSTPDAIRKTQAQTMKRYMDTHVDPCQDFYNYACGNWLHYNPIPPDKAGFDTFEILRENLDVVLRDILTEKNINTRNSPSKYQNHPKNKTYSKNAYAVIFQQTQQQSSASTLDPEDPVIKVKNLYLSCVDEKIVNQRGEKPLLKLLKELRGWPVIDINWREEDFDMIWLLGHLRLFNNDILISEWVGPDIKNSGEYLIQLDQTSLGLPTRDYFLMDSNIRYLEAYRVYMITTANLLGAQINNATRDVDTMIAFEISLAKITASHEKRRNVSEIYSRLTVGELQSLVPQLDLMRYLSIVLGRDVEHSQILICYCLDYLQDLMILLSQTPPRTVANYILWRFVRHRVNNLDSRFHEAKQRFYYVIFGREKTPPKWQTCVTQVNSNMGMTVGSLFVQKYFDERSKNDTIEMTSEIRNAFRKILSNIYWLDEDTKSIAQLKLDAMKLRIGYPDFLLNKENLRERYLDVKIQRNYYFENVLSILRHLTKIEHGRLGKLVDKTIWNTPPAVVNAYYSRNKNQIMFPAGILQPPFYQKFFPRCLNYGGIGVVIGHEITHGFDDKGRLFDQEGNLMRWWRDGAIQEFHNRAQCLIDQYNSYVVPEIQIQVDGVNTQGENIADNGGIKQAYKAYMKWLELHPNVDETLPGLNLTNKQLFFLNFAQVWCGSSRPEALRNKIKTAVHAPGQFRVMGTLSNFDDFAKAYNCPIGSPMNPKNKCSVW